jgi:aquaporin Z
LAALALRGWLANPAVRFAATAPGMPGPWVAFLAETVISFGLMLVILIVSNRRALARLTSWCAAALTATYIILETPLSGMSMNPARSLAPALFAQLWPALWIYFLAPPLGMLLAAQVYVWVFGQHAVICAKLHHHNDKRCIFHCGYRIADKLNDPVHAS